MPSFIEIMVGIAIVIILIFSAVSPHYEAKSFNDCTGGRATYWTALFTELRVEKCK